ncbi:MAG TPA: NAD(P)/FAD-dependent oxidoreductase [Alphaproteobacteria bacterium]
MAQPQKREAALIRLRRALSPAAGTVLRVVRIVAGVTRVVQGVSMPWLLLGTRLWLGQVVLIQQAMAMMLASHAWQGGAGGGGLATALPLGGLGDTLHVLGPLFLMTGLLTRPVALAMLIELTSQGLAEPSAQSAAPEIALLAWLLVVGPGALSLDRLLGRGLTWSAFGPARIIDRVYGWATRTLEPATLLLMRLGMAAVVATPVVAPPSWLRGIGVFPASMLPDGVLAALAGSLVVGAATRPIALILAGMIPLSGITMSMDDRVDLLLLCLIMAAAGAGRLSLDSLVVRWAQGARDEHGDAEADLPHVVVVGGGFGGVAAARGLRNARCRITLIDRRNHHLFQPLLYQVATAALSPAEIATPIRSLFRQQANVRVCLAEVTGIDTGTREVLLGRSRMPFDYLVLATGARHSYFGQDSWAGVAPGLKSIEDATAIRGRLLRAFEEAENAVADAERTAWLTFVVVGGGPTGVELAGAIAELARHGMDLEYRAIDPADARVILVQAGPRILPTFAPPLSVAAERSLRALGVDIRLDAAVRHVDGNGVVIGEQHLAARTVLWAAGVAASPVAEWLGRPRDPSGRLIVSPDLSVPGLPGVYAVGDTAACKAWRGGPVPGLAPAAKQAGSYAARAIRAALNKRPPPAPFRYWHLGSLATIGRQAAVVELGPVRISGALAWWFWGAAHVLFLVGGRNRATVVLDWLWAYLTYRRSTRLITGEASATLGPLNPAAGTRLAPGSRP